MTGALRCDKALWSRWHRSSRGTAAAGGNYRPAYKALSHGSRSFHHKSRPAPQSLALENFRAFQTGNAFSTANLKPLRYYPALIPLRLRTLSVSRSGYRCYSSSSTSTSTLPTMSEVKWTGPHVRKTFLDFFAERGHSIGKTFSPPRSNGTYFFPTPWMTASRPILGNGHNARPPRLPRPCVSVCMYLSVWTIL